MQDKVIIIGAGGHAKVIADIILKSGDHLEGFLDDDKKGTVLELPILGALDCIDKYKSTCRFIIGIGDNEKRKKVAEKLDVCWHTAIHPASIIGSDVMIGSGSVIMAGAIINPSVVIGDHCIINTGAVIEHDNMISDYVHISPSATLCGTVRIGAVTHIGASTVIKNNLIICDHCIIGAGTAVVRDITEAGVYVGIPAKRIR